ncbi:MAG TPA: hypothetical protein QGF58_23465 [Myxococcota bacterium]|nr:hypothetical protein [Myxococcota bacterium]
MLAFLVSTAMAADVSPTLDARLSASYWRLGFSGQVRPGVSLGMPWAEPGNVLTEPAALKLEADVQATPAYLRAGGRLTFSPLAVFDITPYAYWDRYYGSFQTLVLYEDWEADYGSNDDIEEAAEGGNRYPGSGFHYGLSGTLKAKVKNVIVAVNGDLSRWDIDVHSMTTEVKDPYFFEREMEVLMRTGVEGGDTLAQANVVLVYEWDWNTDDGAKLRIGDLTTYRKTWTGDDTLLRTGLLVQALTYDERITHTLLVQPYLVDRAYDSAFPPMVAYQLKYAR